MRIKEDLTGRESSWEGCLAQANVTSVILTLLSLTLVCKMKALDPMILNLFHLPIKHTTTELNCMPDARTTMITKTDSVLLSWSLHSSQEDNKQIAPVRTT